MWPTDLGNGELPGGPVIGKYPELGDISRGWYPGDYAITLGSKETWENNRKILLEIMQLRLPIRDISSDLENPGGFLELERELLD